MEELKVEIKNKQQISNESQRQVELLTIDNMSLVLANQQLKVYCEDCEKQIKESSEKYVNKIHEIVCSALEHALATSSRYW